ncbi:MAG: hypothetical protein ACXWNQ_06670 [Anaerolineales bacterium]
MRRVAARFIVLVFGLSMAACLPRLQLPALVPATPSPSTPSIQLSATPQVTLTLAPSSTATSTPTSTAFTPIPPLTPTGTPSTPLDLTTTITATGTPSTLEPSVTSTFAESISLDKLPKDTVYKPVRIHNATRAQMDISLHCTTHKGLQTVLEYDSVRNLSIQAPDGDYIYVVYVGGRMMSGSFSLLGSPNLTITVYADRVTVH